MTKSAATAKLDAQGLQVQTGDARFSETVKAGLVVTTDPAPLDRVAKGGTVTLFLSKGPERYAVPKLAGDSVADATAALQASHLSVGAQTQAYSETVDAGDVISTNPAAGTSVRPSTAVALVVSKGMAPATVPSFVGMTLAAAQAAAAKNHLTLDSSAPGQYSTTVAQGSVVSQGTKPGTQEPRGSTVAVVLSLGPPLVEVPNVFGMDKNDAKRELQKAGFKVVVRRPAARVTAQPGLLAEPGRRHQGAAGQHDPAGHRLRLVHMVERGDRWRDASYPRRVRSSWYFYGFPPGAPGWAADA